GYVYHFAVGRLVGPAAYSVVAAAVGAASLLTLPALVLQLIAVRFTSVTAARGQLGPVRRLVRLLSGLSLGMGVPIAVVMLPAGPAIAFAQSLTLLRGLPHAPPQAATSVGEVARYAAPAAVAVIGVTYLYNIDVILARHYLPSREAGIYAAGAVLARVTYFLGL